MGNEIQETPFEGQAFSAMVHQYGKENICIDRADTINQAITINFSSVQRLSPDAVITTDRIVNTDYFNLFVVGREPFEQDHFLVPADRVLSAYWTNEELRKEYGPLTQEIIERIKTFPALFMAEAEKYYAKAGEGQQVFFGFIDSLRVQDNGVKIRWQPIWSIPMARISAIGFALGMKNMSRAISEINHTHWAIKRINLIEELKEAGLSLFG